MSVIPALWEVEAGGSQGQEFETSLANMLIQCELSEVNGWPGTVAYACNLSTLGGRGGRNLTAKAEMKGRWKSVSTLDSG
ncbi:hypothetical protein AAY473_027971 [Plecturocebus cupreus]